MYILNEKFIEEMYENAKIHPWDFEKNLIAPVETLFENVRYEKENLNLMLTYNIYSTGPAWQFSIVNSDHSAAKPEIIKEVVLMVLGKKAIQLPENAFPPELRNTKQFCAIAE